MIHPRNRITFEEVSKIFMAILAMNILFAAILFPWVTKEDIEHLPTDPLDKFLSLFFLAFTSFTTIGFGEYDTIVIKSRRLKILITIYILLAISGAASFFFNF